MIYELFYYITIDYLLSLMCACLCVWRKALLVTFSIDIIANFNTIKECENEMYYYVYENVYLLLFHTRLKQMW